MFMGDAAVLKRRSRVSLGLVVVTFFMMVSRLTMVVRCGLVMSSRIVMMFA
jgi:hypothetical protein